MTLTPAQEWWTPAQIAASGLPDLPTTERGVNTLADRLRWREATKFARRRSGKGGGWEYSWRVFPNAAQRALLKAVAAPKLAPEARVRDEVWTWYDALPQPVKDKATARLLIVQKVEALEPAIGRHLAVVQVARMEGVGARTIWSWLAMVEGVQAQNRLAYLAPRNRAAEPRPRGKDCEPEFFEVIRSAYLRLSGPCFTDCYRDAVDIAQAKGWVILPERTMRRRLDATVPRVSQVLAREGIDKLKRLYPPQVRDKTSLTALEAVNADFHKFDVFVRWPTARGEPPMIVRPQMVAFQDIYSGRILAWRMDLTPNSTAVQLAAGDMIETWGIPRHVLFDNGREFAAKSITGGAATRFRFKAKDDDIQGLFSALGCDIHWASPYHGQAKPIERAFEDMCHSIAKDIRFDGAYTGNTPMAKPEDYGSRAIALDYFLKVVGERITKHNLQQNRQSPTAYQRSFAEVFNESYASAPIAKATEAQRRMWLLGAEGLRADTNNGGVWFQGNEFWAAWMHAIAGQRLIIRFDPADYLAGLHVYSADNAYLGHAPVRQAVGFFDADEARVHARARKDWMNAEKKALAALKKYEAAQIGAMLDEIAVPEAVLVEAKVVKPVFGKPAHPEALITPPKFTPAAVSDDIARRQAQMVVDLDAHRAPPAPEVAVTTRETFRWSMDVARRIAEGAPVTAEEDRWLRGYLTTAEYRAEKLIWDHYGDAMFG
jgi:putative transposase